MNSEQVRPENNNFHLIRFVAATLVIFSHCYPLSGHNAIEPYGLLTGYQSFGELAVEIFFIISGFLITKSWFNKPKLLTYLKNRFLRIFPGLLVSVTLTALVLGTFITKLNPIEYLKSWGTYDFILNVTLYPIRYALPGVFLNNPLPQAVNGSLWSLPVEFALYLIVAVFGMMTLLARRWFLLGLLIVSIVLELIFYSDAKHAPQVFLTMPAASAVRCANFFLLGALAYHFKKLIPIQHVWAVLALGGLVATFHTPVGKLASYLFQSYLVLYVAFCDIPLIRHFGKQNDISYGLYIYAFPIQQWIISRYPTLPIPLFFLAAFALTLIPAILSWRFIEKPALQFKKVDFTLPFKRFQTSQNGDVS